MSEQQTLPDYLALRNRLARAAAAINVAVQQIGTALDEIRGLQTWEDRVAPLKDEAGDLGRSLVEAVGQFTAAIEAQPPANYACADRAAEDEEGDVYAASERFPHVLANTCMYCGCELTNENEAGGIAGEGRFCNVCKEIVYSDLQHDSNQTRPKCKTRNCWEKAVDGSKYCSVCKSANDYFAGVDRGETHGG